MLLEQLVVSVSRKCLEPSILTFLESHSEQKREFFVNGSPDLKFGLTWKLSLRCHNLLYLESFGFI